MENLNRRRRRRRKNCKGNVKEERKKSFTRSKSRNDRAMTTTTFHSFFSSFVSRTELHKLRELFFSSFFPPPPNHFFEFLSLAAPSYRFSLHSAAIDINSVLFVVPSTLHVKTYFIGISACRRRLTLFTRLSPR